MIIIKLMSRRIFALIIILVAFMAGYVYWSIHRSLPNIKPTINNTLLKKISTTSNITWPETGQSAIGVLGTNILLTNKAQDMEPTASTAKMITALVVLDKKPLILNQTGPNITLTQNDVDIYNTYLAKQGSVVPVAVGENISEYQMIQAMLLPSANNMADSLALWAYGSLNAYSLAANQYLKSQGIINTVVGDDASGFSPSTKSTAGDLVKIGEIVMNSPVLASIVGQKNATGFPLTSSIKNVNYLLGENNIIGVKTGNTDQAGGVFVSASEIMISNKPVIIVTANLGSKTLVQSMNFSLPLIKSGQANVTSINIVTKNTVAGYYTLPWDKKKVEIKTRSSLDPIVWQGGNILPFESIRDLSVKDNQNKVVGNISLKGSNIVDSKSVNLYLASKPTKPSLIWKILHP